MLTQQKENAIQLVLDLKKSGKISKSDAIALVLALVEENEKKDIFHDTLEEKHESN